MLKLNVASLHFSKVGTSRSHGFFFLGEDSIMSRCDRIVEVWALKHHVRRGLRNASAGALRISFSFVSVSYPISQVLQ